MTTIRFKFVLITLTFLLATNAGRQRLSFCSAFLLVPATTTVRQQRQFQVAPTIASQSATKAITTTIRTPTTSSCRCSGLWLLPTASASTVASVVSVPRVAVTAGMIGLSSQLLLTRIFQQQRKTLQQKDCNNSDIAAYTAHNLIAFFLMLLVSYIGVSGWWGVRGTPTQLNFATERILTHLATNNVEIATTVQWLASTIFGMFVFWDIPTSIVVKQLRNWDVIIHHIIMALVALLGATQLPTCYLLFFLGVSELSSLPLIIYDQLSTMTTVLTTQQNEKLSQQLQKYRDKAQIVAAISFTWIRAILFPKVVFGHFLPDVWYVLSSSKGALALPKSLIPVLWFGIAATVGFTLLQWMWFVKMVKSVVIGKIPPVWMNRDNENANDQDDSILALLFDP